MAAVFEADNTDPRMQLAIDQARGTFKFLWRELSWEYRRIVPGLQFGAVKFPFATDGSITSGPDFEHMWVTDIQFDGSKISGTLMNQPNDISDLNQGDDIVRPLEDLTDWMYVMENKAYGGFSVQIMRSQMPKQELEGHDKAWGIDFCDPKFVRLHPFADAPNPGSETNNQGSFWSRRFKRKQVRPIEPHDEMLEIFSDLDLSTTPEHPMSVNSVDRFLTHLTTTPALATEPDDDGWTQLQREALAGNLGQVDALLIHGADPMRKNPNGHSAIELAQTLGWTNVLHRLQATKH